MSTWKKWTEEPWDATMNGTIHRSGRYLGEMDEPDKPKPGYASDADVANAFRAVECVNALSEVRTPAAVPAALDALTSCAAALRRVAVLLGDDVRPEIDGIAANAAAAIAALDEEITDE